MTALNVDMNTARRIAEYGCLAPSGDNLQPWTMSWDEGVLLLGIDESRDRSLYNFHYRASLVALGAMIENIAVAAPSFGLEANIRVDESIGRLPTVRVTFTTTGDPEHSLHAAIAKRCTNRKRYRRRAIDPEVIDQLRLAVPEDGRSSLQMIEEASARRTVARAASFNDALLLKVRALHDGLFEAVRWTDVAARQSRDGLDVRTLELGPASVAFRAMRSWRIASLMNAAGGSVFAPRHSYQAFISAPLFAFLAVEDCSATAVIEGGRRMQRLWLTATRLGLSVQPMSGLLYLLPYLDGTADALSDDALELLKRGRDLLQQVLRFPQQGMPIILFRLGYSEGPPSARAMRRSPSFGLRLGESRSNN